MAVIATPAALPTIINGRTPGGCSRVRQSSIKAMKAAVTPIPTGAKPHVTLTASPVVTTARLFTSQGIPILPGSSSAAAIAVMPATRLGIGGPALTPPEENDEGRGHDKPWHGDRQRRPRQMVVCEASGRDGNSDDRGGDDRHLSHRRLALDHETDDAGGDHTIGAARYRIGDSGTARAANP